MAKTKAPSRTVVRLLRQMVEENSVLSFSRYGASPFIRIKNTKVPSNAFFSAHRAGYIVQTETKPSFRTTDYELTEAGRKVVEETPPEPEIEPRLAITRGTRDFPAGFLVEIWRETPKRHYVRKIRTGGFGYWEVIHGLSPNEYVDAGDILYDNVTPEQYEKLIELHSEHKQWEKQVNDQMEEELRPIKDRYEARRVQKEQEVSMMASELFHTPTAGTKRVKNG